MTARLPLPRFGGVFALCLAAALGLMAGVNPTLALVAASAAAYVAVLVSSFRVATGVFIVVTFMNLPDNAAKAIGLLLAIALVAKITKGRERDLNFASAHPAVTAALALFLAWTLLGVLWADSVSAVISALSRYALNFALFFIIYAAVRARRDVPLLVGAFVFGCAIAASYGLLNPPAPGPYDDLSRIGGTLGDPNGLAAVLVVGLFVGAALAVVRSVPGAVRIGAIFAGVLCVAGIALSLSRGGLLALGVALAVGVLVAGRWRVHIAILALAVVIGTVGYFAAYAPPQALQRITTAQGGTGRSDIWLVGWRMFEAHPVAGVGAGNFPVDSVKYLLRPGTITFSRYIVDQPKVAHNTYLNILAENGVVGAALFLGLLVFALRSYRQSWQQCRRAGDRDLEMFAYALFIGLVGFLAACFFLSNEFNKQLWILLALAPAMLHLSRERAEEAGTASLGPAPSRASPQLIGVED